MSERRKGLFGLFKKHSEDPVEPVSAEPAAPSQAEMRLRVAEFEQARVEAIGSQAMEGMADNLDRMLEDKFHRASLADVVDKSDAPLEEAVAMLVREKITGRTPPKSAEAVVDLWRDWIEERAGEAFEKPAQPGGVFGSGRPTRCGVHRTL